jgi:hypothetical protein
MVQHRSTSPHTSSRRRRHTGTRAIISALVVTIAVAIVFIVARSRSHEPQPMAAAVTDSDTGARGQIAPVQQRLSRRMYPYSVVAGGVYSTDELTAAMVDPTVADHYHDLVPAAMHPEVVNSPREAYMSYRIADRVYWTTRKLPLHQGETILTDGREAVRARCGNRLSDVPRSPTSADEPAGAAFEVDTALPAPAHAVVPSRPIQAGAMGSPTGSPLGSLPAGDGIAQPLAAGGASLLGPSGYGSAPGAQTAFAPFGLAFPVGAFERRPGGNLGSFPPGTTPGATGDPGTDPGTDPGQNGPPFIPQVPGGLSQDPPTGPPNGGGPNNPVTTDPPVQNGPQPPTDHRSVPEPASLALWGMGTLWMARRLNRRSRRSSSGSR